MDDLDLKKNDIWRNYAYLEHVFVSAVYLRDEYSMNLVSVNATKRAFVKLNK